MPVALQPPPLSSGDDPKYFQTLPDVTGNWGRGGGTPLLENHWFLVSKTDQNLSA